MPSLGGSPLVKMVCIISQVFSGSVVLYVWEMSTVDESNGAVLRFSSSTSDTVPVMLVDSLRTYPEAQRRSPGVTGKCRLFQTVRTVPLPGICQAVPVPVEGASLTVTCLLNSGVGGVTPVQEPGLPKRGSSIRFSVSPRKMLPAEMVP